MMNASRCFPAVRHTHDMRYEGPPGCWHTCMLTMGRSADTRPRLHPRPDAARVSAGQNSCCAWQLQQQTAGGRRRACHDVTDLDSRLGAAKRTVEPQRTALLHCGQHLDARDGPHSVQSILNQSAWHSNSTHLSPNSRSVPPCSTVASTCRPGTSSSVRFQHSLVPVQAQRATPSFTADSTCRSCTAVPLRTHTREHRCSKAASASAPQPEGREIKAECLCRAPVTPADRRLIGLTCRRQLAGRPAKRRALQSLPNLLA